MINVAEFVLKSVKEYEVEDVDALTKVLMAEGYDHPLSNTEFLLSPRGHFMRLSKQDEDGMKIRFFFAEGSL